VTHDDFYEQKLMKGNRAPALELSRVHGNETDFSIDNQQQFVEDSHLFADPYAPFYRPSNDQKAYLVDESELNNEGELIGYSEQILGKINDMAPGIPY